MRVLGADDSVKLTLEPAGFRVVALRRLRAWKGVAYAPLGLLDMLNGGGGAVLSCDEGADGVRVNARGPGRFGVYAGASAGNGDRRRRARRGVLRRRPGDAGPRGRGGEGGGPELGIKISHECNLNHIRDARPGRASATRTSRPQANARRSSRRSPGRRGSTRAFDSPASMTTARRSDRKRIGSQGLPRRGAAPRR